MSQRLLAISTPKLWKSFRQGAAHAPVARLARTSRSRVTAIMNRNTKDISTDLLLRVLYSLGYTAKIKFQKAA
jgi:hypothetical protein